MCNANLMAQDFSIQVEICMHIGHEAHITMLQSLAFILGYVKSSQDYNIEFVEPPPYDCQCPVCLETFKDKVCFQTKCCGNHICSDCATKLKNTKKPCAVCREHSHKFDATEDKFFTRQFLSLKVYCYYSKFGCPWTGELRQLDEHIKHNCRIKFVRCHYCNEHHHNIDEHLLTCRIANSTITCPNHCYNFIQRKNIEAHLENECPLRAVSSAIQKGIINKIIIIYFV